MPKNKFHGQFQIFLKRRMRDNEFHFLTNSIDSILRLLPHIEMDSWERKNHLPNHAITDPRAWWLSENGEQRRAIGLRIYIPQVDLCIQSKVRRLRPGLGGVANISRVLDSTEMSICSTVVELSTNFLRQLQVGTQTQSLIGDKIIEQFTNSFDESVILNHLTRTHKLSLKLTDIVEFLKELAEQSYENKSLSFGILIDKKKSSLKHNEDKYFPKDFLKEKKFKAFTDGYRSAILIDSTGRIKELVDLEKFSVQSYKGEHYYPHWSKNLSLSSIKNIIGFGLTRQGDILFFENGSLRFTRRFGNWQYWNHSYIIEILKSKARRRHVQPTILGKVVAKLYKYALDISFRHSGALFVIMRNQTSLPYILRDGDGIYDVERDTLHREFEKFLVNKSILGLDKNVIIELASIDGAVIFSNNGYLLAYGAVLTPKKKTGVQSEQGSRSKAAIGASHYGLSIKISSDGGISIFDDGKKFIEV